MNWFGYWRDPTFLAAASPYALKNSDGIGLVTLHDLLRAEAAMARKAKDES